MNYLSTHYPKDQTPKAVPKEPIAKAAPKKPRAKPAPKKPMPTSTDPNKPLTYREFQAINGKLQREKHPGLPQPEYMKLTANAWKEYKASLN